MNILILSRRKNYYSTRRLCQAVRKSRHKVQVIDPLKCVISLEPAIPNRLSPKCHSERERRISDYRGETFRGVYPERDSSVAEFTLNASKVLPQNDRKRRAQGDKRRWGTACKIYLGNQEIKDIDIVIPRPGVIGLDHTLAVIKQFELQRIPVVNNAWAIAAAKNKFGCLQVLAQQGLPFPKTVMSRSSKTLRSFIGRLGGVPLVVKFMQGAQGTGVLLAESFPAVHSTIDATLAIGLNPLLQQYIPESHGQDIRILVVGDKVIAAMRRYSHKKDFRSNIHRGGYAEKVGLSQEYKKLALRATKLLGLQIAGVDIIESSQGPMIIEVNTSPGFQGLEKVTHIDIAMAIIRFVVKYARQSQ